MSLDRVNSLDHEEFVAKFGSLYEHSPWVAEAASRGRPFDSFAGMRGAFERAVRNAPQEHRIALIKSHPDLAGKAAISGDLTLESTQEQASAGLDRLSAEEYKTFTKLNDAYKEKFDIPMIFAVREHTKESILENAEARLKNSGEEEVERALEEINKIAQYRLREIVVEGEKR
ncbi:2-oxo-4-hydroxy-4-carboxy-5-ureidoimidazoline decarboxylase [soil metagenome]